eukprot:TRINITY_DN25718_c0_g1_i1.p2 TRINITY_DN25718_c0_g1~~TRINITY_DN25718_c0_g1_i1.p2  ORF type:complete len:123 (+),score=22.09 TRINITY_DN25718_c0_g1_i1:256-624(+)
MDSLFSSEIVTSIELFQEFRAPFVFFAQVLHKPSFPYDILANDVVPLLSMFDNIIEFLHPFEEKHVDYLGIGDVGVFTDLGGDGGAKLGDGDDVVKVVDVNDGRDRPTRFSEEIQRFSPRFF